MSRILRSQTTLMKLVRQRTTAQTESAYALHSVLQVALHSAVGLMLQQQVMRESNSIL
jgi:hypothetical protein